MSNINNNIINSNSNKNIIDNNNNNNKYFYSDCIEYYSKLSNSSSISTNSQITNQLKSNHLKIILNNLNIKEIQILSKILQKFFYFNHITISSSNATTIESKKIKDQKLSQIISSLSKQISMNKNLITLTLKNLTFSEKNLIEILSSSLLQNTTLIGISFTKLTISLENYEILLKFLLTHKNIEYVDLSENNLNEKNSNLISRIIIRQTQRRDQIIWAYSLRNEKPINNDFMKGLISINLRNNNLNNDSCDFICNALIYDNYIRCIDLNHNKIGKDGCKKFIKLLRKNNTILTIDLRNNFGYDEKIHARIVMKMCKNLKFLNNLFKEKKINQKEFFYFKDFVDWTFFNVEIPKEWENKLKENVNVNNNENYFDNNNNYFDNNEIDNNNNKKFKNFNYNNNKNERLISENNQLKSQNALLKKEINLLKNNNNNNNNKNYKHTNKNLNYNEIENFADQLNNLMNNSSKKINNNKINNNNNENKIYNYEKIKESLIQEEK